MSVCVLTALSIKQVEPSRANKHPQFFFLSRPLLGSKFTPGLIRQPRAVYLSPFCIGQFPLFRGISKPILGLAWAATGESPRYPHRRAFSAPSLGLSSRGHPHSFPFPLFARNLQHNLHPCVPTIPAQLTPLSSNPSRKRKACCFSSRVGVRLFPPSPVTSLAPSDWPMPRWWRHRGLPHWPTRFIDISTVHPLSSPQKWVTRTGVARTRLCSLSLSLFHSLYLSPLLSLTLYIFLPRSLLGPITLCVEAWRFRRVPCEISAAMFPYQTQNERKKIHYTRLQRKENNIFFCFNKNVSSIFFYNFILYYQSLLIFYIVKLFHSL